MPLRERLLIRMFAKLQTWRAPATASRRRIDRVWAVEKFLYRFYRRGSIDRPAKTDGIVLFSNEPLLAHAKERGISTTSRSLSDVVKKQRECGQSPYPGYRDGIR
jgi:hypothetical protein